MCLTDLSVTPLSGLVCKLCWSVMCELKSGWAEPSCAEWCVVWCGVAWFRVCGVCGVWGSVLCVQWVLVVAP